MAGLVRKNDAMYGFWTAVGVLAALAVWHVAQSRFPKLNPGLDL